MDDNGGRCLPLDKADVMLLIVAPPIMYRLT